MFTLYLKKAKIINDVTKMIKFKNEFDENNMGHKTCKKKKIINFISSSNKH